MCFGRVVVVGVGWVEVKEVRLEAGIEIVEERWRKRDVNSWEGWRRGRLGMDRGVKVCDGILGMWWREEMGDVDVSVRW